MCTWTVTGAAGPCQWVSDFQTVSRSFISYWRLKLLFRQCYVDSVDSEGDLKTGMSAIIWTGRITFYIFEQDWADSDLKQDKFVISDANCAQLWSQRKTCLMLFPFPLFSLSTCCFYIHCWMCLIQFLMPLKCNIACIFLLYYTSVALHFFDG